MNSKKITITLLIISFLLSVTLGMMDYETKSLVHLFTAEWGNILALILYTLVFTAIGWMVVGFFWGVKSLLR